MQNHFELFQLEPRFEIDLNALNAAYREIQSQVHPDRFVSASEAEQRVAMQWATQANEAYQTLKNPLRRATYLCEMHGASINAESNTAMPVDFLMQQIHWRETFEEVEKNPALLEKLDDDISSAHRHCLTRLTEHLNAGQYAEAVQEVRQLMFLEKFRDDLYSHHD